MRHRKAGVHLSRTSAHRKALFSNLIAALLTNERIRTTDAKAKEKGRAHLDLYRAKKPYRETPGSE